MGFGQVDFKRVEKMLRRCADGFTAEQKTHSIWIRSRGKKYHLPKGAHKKAKHEIEIGQVKAMIRHLEIDTDCAEEHLPQIR